MIWKQISENYECSEDGHIRNRKTKHVLKEFDSCHDGYLRTQFDGKTQTVHRVIAKAFIKEDPDRKYVNHKDGTLIKMKKILSEEYSMEENIK